MQALYINESWITKGTHNNQTCNITIDSETGVEKYSIDRVITKIVLIFLQINSRLTNFDIYLRSAIVQYLKLNLSTGAQRSHTIPNVLRFSSKLIQIAF